MDTKDKTLRLAGMLEDSIVDGPGLRLAVFTQGCLHACKGCHNPHTWPLDGGGEIPVEDVLDRVRSNPLCSGVTLSGGEPVLQAAACAALIVGVKEMGKNVWMYSGYTFEQLCSMMKKDENICRLIEAVDVLVDGPFVIEERDLTLLYRGSRNQRVIDVVQTRKKGEIVLWVNPYQEEE